MGVFQQLKQNLLRSDEFDCVSGADYPSEYSEDYNHSGGHTGLLKKGVRLTASCDDLPHLPHLPHLPQLRDKVREETGLGGDSGFNSDPHSSLVYSDCLENYGLNGPLPDCSSLEDSQEPSQISEDKNSDFQPPPSVTSSTTRKRREKEVKQATIRQHYYPEGGWGYIVLLSAFLVNILAHGLQLSFGVLLVAIQRRWSSQVSPVSASEYPDISCQVLTFPHNLQVLWELSQYLSLSSSHPSLWLSARGSPPGSRRWWAASSCPLAVCSPPSPVSSTRSSSATASSLVSGSASSGTPPP